MDANEGCRNDRPGRKAWRAFTLIELLVVIGIIGIMAGLLMPVLGSARESARSAKCMSNLRNMVQMAQAYTIDYDGRMPVSYYYVASEMKWYCWDVTSCGMWPNYTYEPGILWQGMDISSDSSEIHQCPSFDPGDMWTGEEYTGYNYNTSYLGHGPWEPIPKPAKIGSARKPRECIVFGDGEYSGGANKFMRAPFGDQKGGDKGFSGRWAGTQGFRHLGKTNAVFLDGHGASLGERYTNSYSNESPWIAEGTGFISEDDSLYDLH